jgi:hypothetical protein
MSIPFLKNIANWFTQPKRTAHSHKAIRQPKTRLSLEALEGRQLMAVVLANFADVPLPANSYFNGPDLAGTDEPDPFGGALPIKVGSFKSGGATFQNEYNPNFGSWNGFAYSNKTDNLTAGFQNQFSAFAGSGLSDKNYGIASGYVDSSVFDPANAEQLASLPQFNLPVGGTISEVYVTNATYAALSMTNGDSFAKKFGGASGDDPDWFKLTAYGTTASGALLPNTAELYLADYRFSDNAQDFVLSDWAKFDLSSLSGANRVYFNLSSSDVGTFGMNTPATFAIDNIKYNLPSVNRAPVLSNTISPTLTSISEDTQNPTGTSIASLAAQGISDEDTGAVRGVAIVGLSHRFQGTWQYSPNNGTTWLALGNPTPKNARLLPATTTTLVRFIPKENFTGVVNMTYRAWDQSRGTPSGTLNLSGTGKTGGATAISSGVKNATLTITAVNDAPELSNANGDLSYQRGASGVPFAATAIVSDRDSYNFNTGRLTVQVTAGQQVSNRIEITGTRFVVKPNLDVVRMDATNGNKLIGKLNLNGGIGLADFEITLNSNANASIVAELLKSLQFRTSGTSDTKQRTLSISLSDGDGGTSIPLTRTINVS